MGWDGLDPFDLSLGGDIDSVTWSAPVISEDVLWILSHCPQICTNTSLTRAVEAILQRWKFINTSNPDLTTMEPNSKLFLPSLEACYFFSGALENLLDEPSLLEHLDKSDSLVIWENGLKIVVESLRGRVKFLGNSGQMWSECGGGLDSWLLLITRLYPPSIIYYGYQRPCTSSSRWNRL
ncbi:hypothetical protein M427DRAFT_295160 [Gonapodya prolifera JEL478]|uniref:Uncharacterized protein n=1 Tax=Gonapodya prolifera (strain JEL478) TaxID=1344416 RepID=A0A139AHH0_GONPJ|nr:hypothetical protein M427DRAFT_295160 [Gonapodya prolifera JEL478]|eukprot:KXS16247.1 hypothetical protein M427DRAFT_295160 [Gonapodya prolifera JEL478]